MSLKGKLNRMKKHLSHNQPNEKKKQKSSGRAASACDGRKNIPFLKEWEKLGAAPYHFEDSFCLIREVTYSLDDKHGLYSFAELPKIIEAWNKKAASSILYRLKVTSRMNCFSSIQKNNWIIWRNGKYDFLARTCAGFC
ncbi:hypothetical protein BsIDN1_38600 [Bacillus safensis]|uniref:Uncharacterized protein n=1 Tax=Bacillus safensis TaxID=561879 RepID=A0A5S9MCD5_BACIA|nr:hypothetical protein BsIDN1_38600 [Bacillus safensis]